MEKNRSRKEKSIVFIFSNKNINLTLIVLLGILGIIIIFNFIDGNVINVIAKKIIANAQLASSTVSSNIVDLKVSERNNNFVWTSANRQVNPELHLTAGIHYMIQIESMNDNNIPHQLIIQEESGKQLAKSIGISDGQTDDFPFTFSNIGKYQYYCQYHPKTMHGNIVVS